MSADENGKISMAVLSQQILTLTAEVTALRVEMRELNNATTEYRVIQSRHDTQIVNLGADYDALSTRMNGWSVVNSLGVILASILALFFGNRQ